MEDPFDDVEEVADAQTSFEAVMLAGIAGHKRSQQRQIGPSGLGTPCPRKLAYQLAQADTARRPETEWRQTVGTGVHKWSENTFDQFGGGKWLTETRVTVGEIVTPHSTLIVHGTSDLYYLPDDTVADIKVPGSEGLKKMRKDGPGQGYKVQGQLYGVGYRNMGLRPKTVAIAAMPAAGEWRDRVWLEEPFDERVAVAALKRAGKVMQAIEEDGLEETLGRLRPVDDYCRKCDFARPAPGRPTCPTATPGKNDAPVDLRDLLGKSRGRR